jgi:hypothetical protein
MKRNNEAERRFLVGELVSREDFRGREYGVCCRVWEFEDGRMPRYNFAFDSGAILQRSGSEASREFRLTGRVSESLANYKGENFDQLRKDCTNGVFNRALNEARALGDGAHWPEERSQHEERGREHERER